MPTFRCVPLTTADATRLRQAETDDFGYAIRRFTGEETYPCRYTLRETSARDGMMLLSYRTALPKSVYGHPMAIFLSTSAQDRFDAVDAVPEIVRNRLVSLRAFDRAGSMLYDANAIVEPQGDHEGAIRRIFAREDVAYINAHTAKAGCMLTHIARA